MPLTRRQLMRNSVALAAATTAACGGAPQRTGDPVDRDDADEPLRVELDSGVERDLGDVVSLLPAAAFPLGVAAGDVQGGRVRLWTRISPVRSDSEIFVWVLDEDSNEVVVARAVCPSRNRAVHITLDGFAPGTRLKYAFVEVGPDSNLRSDVGRVLVGRADDDMSPLVIGATSCTSNRRDLSLLAEAGARELDAFISLGDTVYADGAQTRSDYRGFWAHNLGTRGYRTLRSSTGLYATWDDHEVDNNWDPETFDFENFQAARDAFFEHLPRDLDEEDEGRVWRSRRYGTCAEIFLLDSRSERTPSSRLDGDYLSQDQIDWLKLSLARSPARFKLIASSVPISILPFPMEEQDRWSGYATQRTEILSYIEDEGIDGVLWLSGDIHMGFAGRVSPEGQPGQGQIEICAGPGAQFTNPVFPWFAKPQFDFTSGENNWVEFNLEPTTGVATVRFWGPGETLLFETSYAL